MNSSDLERGGSHSIPFISNLFPDEEPRKEVGPFICKLYLLNLVHQLFQSYFSILQNNDLGEFCVEIGAAETCPARGIALLPSRPAVGWGRVTSAGQRTEGT